MYNLSPEELEAISSVVPQLPSASVVLEGVSPLLQSTQDRLNNAKSVAASALADVETLETQFHRLSSAVAKLAEQVPQAAEEARQEGESQG